MLFQLFFFLLGSSDFFSNSNRVFAFLPNQFLVQPLNFLFLLSPFEFRLFDVLPQLVFDLFVFTDDFLRTRQILRSIGRSKNIENELGNAADDLRVGAFRSRCAELSPSSRLRSPVLRFVRLSPSNNRPSTELADPRRPKLFISHQRTLSPFPPLPPFSPSILLLVDLVPPQRHFDSIVVVRRRSFLAILVLSDPFLGHGCARLTDVTTFSLFVRM